MERRPVINIEKNWINILKLMEKNGITKKDLSVLFRISVQAVHQKFNPKSLPTLDQIVVLSQIFEKPVEEILVIERFEEDEEYEDIIRKIHENKSRFPKYEIYNLTAVHEGTNIETYYNCLFSNKD